MMSMEIDGRQTGGGAKVMDRRREEGRAVGHSDHFNITHVEGVNAHSEKGGAGGWERRKG